MSALYANLNRRLQGEHSTRFSHMYLLSVLHNHVIFYSTSNSLSYLWGFGFLSLMFLAVQLITGIILVMHYQPDMLTAFDSIVRITNTVPYGWLFRYLHANGASFFFLVVYIHIGRGLYYGSFMAPRVWIWLTGTIIFFLMIVAGFIGYVLPWGQMSLWGATVITNLLSALPYGYALTFWIWGGFSVGGVTLNRFFSLHYLVPFIILALVLAHIYILHDVGSNNPGGIESWVDVYRSSFNNYFVIKDFGLFFVLLVVFFVFVFFYPNALGHPDNYIKANPLVTPAHIVPEWYLLPFYAILRSIPNKEGGVVLMGAAIFMSAIYASPVLWQTWLPDVKMKRSVVELQITKFIYWLFIFNFFLLCKLGAKPIEVPYYEVAQLSTFIYFAIWFLLPIFILIEISLQSVSRDILR